MIAVAELPLARNNGCHAIITVRLRWEGGVSGYQQQN
jgi:hypothetical protein